MTSPNVNVGHLLVNHAVHVTHMDVNGNERHVHLNATVNVVTVQKGGQRTKKIHEDL